MSRNDTRDGSRSRPRARMDAADGGRRSGSPDRPRAARGEEGRDVRASRGKDAARGQTTARPYVMAAARIEQVRQVLGEALQWKYPADAVLSHWFRAHANAGMRDRGEIAEAVFDVLRHLRRYRQFAEIGAGSGTRRLAVLGLASVWPRETLDTGLDEHERAWLDHVLSLSAAGLPRAVRHSVPDWLDERLAALPDAESLLQALNTPAPLDLRINPLKAERDAHRLAFENDQLRREAERLQKLPTAMHEIAGELARPSGI